MRFTFLLLLAFLSASLHASQNEETAQKLPTRLRLVATMRDPTVKGGGDINLSLKLINISGVELAITDTTAEDDFEVEIRTSDEKVVPLTELGRRHATEPKHAFRRVTHELKPGESLDYEISLGSFYQLTSTGQYFVRASRIVMFPKPVANERVVSNRVSFTIQ